ncbi:hypothetical protein [Micromonospora carbonacea]|uniref:Uncharacterized protein n=1 Tax=Micromonospora carbonacea TaxID=47853 RepID=A0A1C5AZ01_9ACTN|nr:hypothetical protein [Micromonospora carbonacea]SCF50383.1 hypothetical protein GA0070563_1318 [Micromonospora carbonacea]
MTHPTTPPASPDQAAPYTPDTAPEMVGYLGWLVTDLADRDPADPDLARGAATYRRWETAQETRLAQARALAADTARFAADGDPAGVVLDGAR